MSGSRPNSPSRSALLSTTGTPSEQSPTSSALIGARFIESSMGRSESEIPDPIRSTFDLIRRTLGDHRFRVRNEADMQEQVARVLGGVLVVRREVVSAGGRFDLQVVSQDVTPIEDGADWRRVLELKAHPSERPTTVVLELKVRASAAAVERQAQRYAMTHGVDGVMVVTSSRRLAFALGDMKVLGGKPFGVVALRSW